MTFGYQLDDEAATAMMRRAFEAGVNFFDTAEAYAGGDAERMVGAAVARGLEGGWWTRDALVIATKLYWGKPIRHVNAVGLSRKHVLEGMAASLRRLRLEYVDVVFAHRPDEHTPMEETVRAFDHLVSTGKALYWGTSMWDARQIEAARAVAARLGLVPPAAEQPEYSMLARERVERQYAPLYHGGLGITAYSPLAAGVLTGKYNGGVPEGSRFTVEDYRYLRDAYVNGAKHQSTWEELLAKVAQLVRVAQRLDATAAQLAIAWTLKNPRVSTVIMGASSAQQLAENLAALAVLPKLTPEVMAELEHLLGNAPPEPANFVQRELDRL